jgi:hypothetical protein
MLAHNFNVSNSSRFPSPPCTESAEEPLSTEITTSSFFALDLVRILSTNDSANSGIQLQYNDPPDRIPGFECSVTVILRHDWCVTGQPSTGQPSITIW